MVQVRGLRVGSDTPDTVPDKVWDRPGFSQRGG